MRREIVMPQLGSLKAVLSTWLVKPGEQVFAGDRLVEVLVNGATFDVASPATGRLAEKFTWPNDVLNPGQVLGLVEEEMGEEEEMKANP